MSASFFTDCFMYFFLSTTFTAYLFPVSLWMANFTAAKFPLFERVNTLKFILQLRSKGCSNIVQIMRSPFFLPLRWSHLFKMKCYSIASFPFGNQRNLCNWFIIINANCTPAPGVNNTVFPLPTFFPFTKVPFVLWEWNQCKVRVSDTLGREGIPIGCPFLYIFYSVVRLSSDL